MRLVQPTDFEILEALDEHGRNVAVNLTQHLDRDRAYINTRLPHLQDHRLVTKIGPADNSGLYELTNRGSTVLVHRDQYDEVSPAEFHTLIEDASE